MTLKHGTCLFLVLTFMLLLTGCNDFANRDPQTGITYEELPLFTMEDGCKVTKIVSDKVYLYRLKCSDVSSATSNSCGNNCINRVIQEPIPDSIRKAELLKQSALAKLSAEEKKILGLVPEQPKEDNAKR